MMLAAALLAVSCVYPFTPDPTDGSGALVIEGDILIGEWTTVKVSRTIPINSRSLSDPVVGSVFVEDDSGRQYNAEKTDESGAYLVNTTDADPSRSYRLHFKDGSTKREYVSAWETVRSAPVIDSLSYNLDYDRERLNIALSMHSRGESFFKWSYVEDWEFHSMFNADLKYIPSKNWSVPSRIEQMVFPESTYYCYKHAESSQIMTFSTEKQSDDRFVDLEFLPIPQRDRRLSSLYRIVVALEPMSKDAYLYWENIKTNSEYTGSLFAPNPSEMVGNIRCVEEPNELVLGYINVAQRTTEQLVLRSSDHKFFKSPDLYVEPVEVGRQEWDTYYRDGFLPFTYVMPGDLSSTLWTPGRCVDCKLLNGGSYEKPDDWPPQN